MKKPVVLPLLASLVAIGPSCVIVDSDPPPPDPYGDISFDWSFAGETDCNAAGVDEIDLVILQGGDVVEIVEREPCVGGGLTLTDFLEGTYQVEIDAFSRTSELLYAGSFVVDVVGGRDNFAGLIELDRVGEDPPPPVGTAALFWSFLYPTDNPIIDCELAGVDEVDVLVTPLSAGGTAAFDATFACSDDGVVLDQLFEGTYEIRLQAYGEYSGDALLLYDSAVEVDVFADDTTDLGDVALARVDDAFGDFELSWSFTDDDCASAGVDEVTVAIQRLGLDAPEDVASYDCAAAAVIRRTFVPGSYVITASATGTTTTYLGVVSADLPPDAVFVAPLNLAPER